MSNKSTVGANLTIAQLALLSALIIAMTFVPYIGYISYGALSITLLHLPVIIGACVLGAKGGAILGGVWGVTCIIKALLAPPTPLEGIIFRNPLVSLIPRVLAGLAAGAVFSLISKHSGKKDLAAALAAVSCCLVNTVLVMGGIYLFYSSEVGAGSVSFGGLTKYILAAFGINALVEIAVGIVIGVPVSNALRKVKTKA